MELILNTFGTSLIKENNNFVVVHKDGRQLISPSSVKTISISKGAKISSDAALLAIEHEIDVLFVENSGTPVGRLWSIKYGSVSTIRRKQLDFTFSPEAVDWIKGIVIQKIDNQVALILTMELHNTVREKAINRLSEYKRKISELNGEIVSDIGPSLRGWEGAASRIYFDCISAILPEELKFEGRSQHPALDAFNCLLNYGYGILYGKIEGALIKAGIDPYVGVFHRDDYNRPVLVFDIIEIYRVWIDYVVINLANQHIINEDFFSIKEDGSYWLEALGKRILIQSVNDYFDEVVKIGALERSRANHINIYAQKLATTFMNSPEKK
ncbi:CRISPR-associated endonuclease Cas1 [bioreactor metagenome]|uniref:CRISPR-associated endonuclease Cas1 n=1 Tax=bioreactor metagenome TaxID=1076179 RepID=A0A644V4F4_9ZZZZ|nr:CRISPR-associated endonuclease Cas1 [Lentimicrobium sp.]MEA5110272.1 CRISPR-associated endonuclease Cas1 [Lentimicrobium sp.]